MTETPTKPLAGKLTREMLADLHGRLTAVENLQDSTRRDLISFKKEVRADMSEIKNNISLIDTALRGSGDINKDNGIQFYVRDAKKKMDNLSKVLWIILTAVIMSCGSLIYVIVKHVLIEP